jgi:hypothetical protein
LKEQGKLVLRNSPPEYFAEDYTIESLGKILSTNGEQLAAISPEASKPIKNLKGLYKDGNCEDTLYNKAYSLEAGKIDRINRDANEFHEPCMSIVWLTQPDKIDEIFGDEGLMKGGLAPRFITLHESAEIQPISWDSKVVRRHILLEYEQLWNELFDAYRLGGECDLEEGQDEEEASETPWKAKFKYQRVGTDRETGQMMYDHYNSLVELRNSSLQDVQQFPARWTENAWRLALVFHAIKHGKAAHREYVEPETCKAALAFMEYFGKAQLALLNRGGAREEKLDADVQKLIDRVEAQEGKRMTFGKLKNNYCYEAPTLLQLVGKSKNKLTIEDTGKTKKSKSVVVV